MFPGVFGYSKVMQFIVFYGSPRFNGWLGSVREGVCVFARMTKLGEKIAPCKIRMIVAYGHGVLNKPGILG